jgi:predicted permease
VRRKELTIRLALGAGGGRLSRQLLTETLLLAAVASLAGLVLASWTAGLLPALVPKVGRTVALDFTWNGRVLAFTTLTCVVAALASGVMPALLWLRSDANQALKEGGRGGSQGLLSHRTRGLLVISEVALATLALIGAGLFVRSFQSARAIHPGFDRSNVVLARFYLAGAGFSTPQLQQFCARLRDRLRSAPGIEDVSYADYAPLGSNAGPYNDLEIEGYVPAQGESMNINRYLVAPGYFQVLRIPLLEGRDFADSDDRDTTPVIIVNQTFARRYFQGASPVGRRVRVGRAWTTVIGLAKDSKYFNVAEAPRPHFFAPYRQRAGTGQQLYFFIKAAGQPAQVMGGLRREVAAVDPTAAAFDVMPLTEWTEVTLFPQKVAASLALVLGLIALVLAAVGLDSVMAYTVTQRTQEIGIRMALGAQQRDVLGDVLGRGMSLTVAGLAAGIAAALAVTRLAASMLVNVSAADPVAFAGAALYLGLVALLASYLPARRATKVDPMVALRCE